jgi:predicted DNA-binding transcriptional regulator AlpA
MTKKRTISIERARALAAQGEAQYEEHLHTSWIAGRFKDATPTEVVRTYESGRNERGQKLSQDEFTGLVERWLELFGAYPSGDDGALDEPVAAHVVQPEELEPQDDTMLRMHDVVRMTGVSARHVRRLFNDGRFPRPLKLSTRRIGWPAGQSLFYAIRNSGTEGRHGAYIGIVPNGVRQAFPGLCLGCLAVATIMPAPRAPLT